ncbi:hypothetical protein L7F22_025373 [Adiantum nelumboides]|nr:hypothetical protein [Adiantum nelumboides]
MRRRSPLGGNRGASQSQACRGPGREAEKGEYACFSQLKRATVRRSTSSSPSSSSPAPSSAESSKQEAGCDSQRSMEACGGGSSSPRCSANGKQMCLCAPTTHVGSFRCRLHRSSSFSKLDRSPSLSAPTNTSPNPTPRSDTQYLVSLQGRDGSSDVLKVPPSVVAHFQILVMKVVNLGVLELESGTAL